MRNILFLFLLVLTLLSCNEKEEKTQSQPYEVETYEILNFCINNKEIVGENEKVMDKLFPPDFDFDNGLAHHSLKSDFSEEDITYIHQQVINQISFNIQTSKVTKKNIIISTDEIFSIHKKYRDDGSHLFWKEINKRYGYKLISICKPLFSKDGNTAIISLSFSSGPESFYGSEYVLKRTNKGWEITKVIPTFIS